jgi:transcription antitermination factor NusG
MSSPMSRSTEPPARSKRSSAATEASHRVPATRPRAAAAQAKRSPARVESHEKADARLDKPAPESEESPFERGARVSVLKGPFAGKVGVFQELDGRGGAHVTLGLLAVRLDVKNLVLATVGRARPRLSSSHRKPLPARS